MMTLFNLVPPFRPRTPFGRFSVKKKSGNFKSTDSPESLPADKASQKPSGDLLPNPPPDASAPGESKSATSARLAAGKEKKANDES
jgi:hypothetical protein